MQTAQQWYLVYQPSCHRTHPFVQLDNVRAFLDSGVSFALATHRESEEQHTHICRALALGIHTDQATHWLKQAF